MAIIDRTSKKFKIISFSVIVIILAVIIKVFIDNWHKIHFNELAFNFPLFVSALLLSVFISLFSALLWRYTLIILGDKIDWKDAWRITVYSQIVRYIPGKVWQYMGKIYFGKKIGLSNKKIILSTLIETICLLSGSFLASLFCLQLFISKGYVSVLYIILLLLAITITIFMLNPRIIEKVINRFGKKWITNPISLNFSYVQILFLVFLYFFLWMLLGFQLHLLVNSFYGISFSHWIYLASFNAFSWLIGFLSIITPSGLGVKEGIFILGFKTIVPVSFAIIVAILIRLYTIVADLLITVIFFVFDRGAWQNLIEFRKTPTILKADEND